MAGYSPSGAGETTLTPDLAPALASALAANWHHS